MTKLEGLLREADDRRVRLETRVADAQRLEWALRQRIEELERRLSDLGQTPPVSPRVRAAEPTQTVAPAAPVQEARRTDGDEFAAVLHQSIMREQARAAAEPTRQIYAPPSAQPGRQVQEPLRAPSAAHGQPVRTQSAAMPVHPPAIPMAPAPPAVPESEAEPVREDEAIIKARALLRAGRTIEQVARETGVEIGALRLMQQMTQRD